MIYIYIYIYKGFANPKFVIRVLIGSDETSPPRMHLSYHDVKNTSAMDTIAECQWFVYRVNRRRSLMKHAFQVYPRCWDYHEPCFHAHVFVIRGSHEDMRGQPLSLRTRTMSRLST